jgi:two-component system response regulator YesN
MAENAEYKVLIIDDELPSREAIRLLGEWDALGVREIGEAADGKEGLRKLREEKPDLVLVDMKMPEMSGPEFLQAAEKEFPGTLMIVVSGYDDFAFTRQAIHSRVVDYLLKPVNRMELNQALAHAFRELEERRRRESEAIGRNIVLNRSLPKLKETVFLSLIERGPDDPVNPADLKLIGADDPDRHFGAAVLRLLNFEEVRRSRFKGDAGLLRFAVANVAADIGNGRIRLFGFGNPKREREVVAIVQGDGPDAGAMAAETDSLMGQAIGKLRELFGIEAVCGVGGLRRGALGLGESYAAAIERSLSFDLLHGGGRVISRSGPAAGRDILPLTGRIAMIRSGLQNPNPHYVEGIAEDYLQDLRKSGRFALGDAFRLLEQFEILLKDMALEVGVPAQELDGSVGVSPDFRDFAQFGRRFLELLNHYCDRIRHFSRTHGAFRIQDIRDYIRQHYFEDIRISMFTEKYFLSREYLMKLFKQEYGCGIYEYVLKVRMEKAKELLRDPNLKIRNVAEMVGYKDKNYFSKAFKHYCGLSPSDYREQMRPL